jgi:hypothetical protein
MRSIISRKGWFLVGIALLMMAAPLRAGESERDRELRHRLSDTVNYLGLDDARATLSDALDQLSKAFNLTFDINEDAFKEAGLKEPVGRIEVAQPTPIPPMHTKIETVLRKILSRVSPSATFLIRDARIEITTTEAIRKEFFAERPTMPGPLPPLVSGAVNKVPLEEALKQLNHFGNVVLDARATREAPQVQVSADLSNVPLDTVVRMFADMAGLSVVPLDNALYVTSKDNARGLLKEREKLRRQRERENKEKENSEKDKKPAAPKAEPNEKKVTGTNGAERVGS